MHNRRNNNVDGIIWYGMVWYGERWYIHTEIRTSFLN